MRRVCPNQQNLYTYYAVLYFLYTYVGLLLESTIAEIFTDQFNPENNFALKTVTVSVGRSLKLFCSDGNAVDNGALYTWFRNGIQIAQLKRTKNQNTNGFSYFEGTLLCKHM